MAKTRRAPVALESGRIVEFHKSGDGWTIDIQFMPDPRLIGPGLMGLCRGVQYWSVKLDAATAAALQSAFEAGEHISYDPALMRRMAFHAVPWKRFLVKTA